jgi:hypothetical protein
MSAPFSVGQEVEWRDGHGGVWPAVVSGVKGEAPGFVLVQTTTPSSGRRNFSEWNGEWVCGCMTLHPRTPPARTRHVLDDRIDEDFVPFWHLLAPGLWVYLSAPSEYGRAHQLEVAARPLCTCCKPEPQPAWAPRSLHGRSWCGILRANVPACVDRDLWVDLIAPGFGPTGAPDVFRGGA